MRLLVTGATGFVGGWLAEELVRAYPEAALFGTSHGHPPPEGLPAELRLIPCDLAERDQVKAAVDRARPDRVFHLAGYASAAGSDPEEVRRGNVEATVVLLETLQRAGRPCRVLLASSGYVYGPTDAGRPADEESAPAPRGMYAESKAAMEREAQAYAGAGLSLVAARAFNHTGPRQSERFVVPAFARQIARIERGLDEPVVQVGNLEAERDFLDVRDVARAYRLLLETEPQEWQAVNVCSGAAVRVRDLLDGLVRLARRPLTVEPDPERLRPSDLPRSVGSPARLQALTGWRPEVPLSQTLADTLDWWRERED